MKSGFTIVELIISMTLTLIIGSMLTALLSQTAGYQGIVDRFTDVNTRAAVVLRQFEKDVMAACIPIQNSMQKKDEKKVLGPAATQPATQESGQEKKKEVKPIEHVFYVQQSKETFKLFTCVTTDALQVYWSKQVGKPKPKIVRVVWVLKPDPDNANSFILTRQEDSNLDLKAYTGKENANIRAYEVINGVQSCSLTFGFYKYKEEQPDKQAQQQEPSTAQQKKKEAPRERSFETRSTWNWPLPEQKESVEKGEKDTKPSEPPLPNFVTLKLSLWDELYERSTEFEYVIPVMVDAVETRETAPQETPPQAAQTPPTAGGKTSNATNGNGRGRSPFGPLGGR